MADVPAHSETMLVRSENLDQLLLLAGQVIVASSTQEMAYRSLQALYDRKQAVDTETVDSSKDLATTTAQISSSLHRLVQDIRTVSLKDFGFRARRLVREIARKTGRRVRFEVEGEDTTVDKAIVEKLYDPISHQLRNAIDHGIEDALTRTRMGKPEEGLVVFRAYNTERETFIEIEDDGAGVDLEAIRRRGVEMGLLDESAPFNEETALHLMCAPGVTTVESVSEVSGRGVGMDVVFSNITALGGTISFKTERGKGSAFTFRIPLVSAVNILDALVIRADDFYYAFPISSVVTTMALAREHITTTFDRGRSIKHLDQLLPLHNLNGVLDRKPCSEEGVTLSVIVVEHKHRRAAFVVSECISPQKLVIIPFDGTLEVPGLAGTTVLAGRKLGFIIDVPVLLSLAMDEGVTRIHAKRARKVTAQDGVQKLAHDTAPASSAEVQAPVRDRGPRPAAREQGASPEAEASDRQEFMAEIEKLMPHLSEAAFAIESDPSKIENINNAFRLFHTIKGNFIMMGLANGGETVHCVESVLDRVRGHEMEVTPEVMDILMDGVSYVEEVVRNARAGQWTDEADEEILRQSAVLLPKVHHDEGIAPSAATGEVTLSHEAVYRSNILRRRGIPFYQLYIEFDAGMQPPFLVACLIYKRVCELGDVLGTTPQLTDIEQGLMEGKFRLLFASSVPVAELEDVLNSLLPTHYGAQAVTLTRFQ